MGATLARTDVSEQGIIDVSDRMTSSPPSHSEPAAVPGASRRPAYRVPVGMPLPRQRLRGWAMWSVLVHAVLIALLVMERVEAVQLENLAQGAGGPGPAGGGGGGNRGSGAQPERIEYLVVSPPPAEAVTQPEVPQIEPPEVPQIRFEPVQPQMPMPKLTMALPLTGLNGGTGADVRGGTGPGTGGGVGSGVGTGRGSAVGPGTGGGGEENYPPTPIEMFIPPLPVPDAARGAHVIVHFDVDERGRVLGIEFTPTRDRGYNRRLREALEGYRFRPGTRPDGTPIRMKAQITIDLP